MTRDEKQLEIHNNILTQNVWSYGIFATGFGKTRIATNLIIECLKRDPNRIIHIVVPTVKLKDQWEQELIKLNLKTPKVFIINSYAKKKYFCDLLIVDELHRTGSQTFSQIFEVPLRFKFFLGLTATLERPDGKHKFIENTFKCAGIVTYEDAVKEGWVKDVVQYNIPVYLDKEGTELYNKINHDYNKYFTIFSKQFELAKECTTSLQARKDLSLMTGMPEGMIKAYAYGFNTTMNKRKTFLWMNKFKLETCKEIINFYKNRKIICFGQTQMFADILARTDNKRCRLYHSALGKKALEKNIQDFEDLDNGVLVTVKAVEEGYDLPSIGVGINAAYNSQPRPYKQKVGRLCRIDNQEKIMINLYLKDFKGANLQDYTWLKAAQKGINGIKSLTSLEELFEIEKDKLLELKAKEIEDNKYTLEKDYTDL